MPLHVNGVPQSSSYRISVARGGVTFSLAQLEQHDWRVSLTIGT